MSRYPEHPGFKGAMDTGRDGAADMAPKVAGRRAEVLADIELNGPSTAEQIAARIDRHWYTTRPRISELKTMGLLVDTGERRDTGMGGKTGVVRLATPEEVALHRAQLAASAEARHHD